MYPEQIICLHDDIRFSEAVEKALRIGDALMNLYDKYSRRLRELSCRVTMNLLEQLKVRSSILGVIRNRDIISFLMENRARDILYRMSRKNID